MRQTERMSDVLLGRPSVKDVKIQTYEEDVRAVCIPDRRPVHAEAWMHDGVLVWQVQRKEGRAMKL